jgi:cyanophycin synthetase
VKATVCRVTRPDGLVVLNADDPLVAAVARRVRARVGWFSMAPDPSPRLARHRHAGGIAWVLRGRRLVEWAGGDEHDLLDVADLAVALGGIARHNVANALAAAGAARGLGATREQVADGLRDFRPTADLSPGRLNLYHVGPHTVIVDFAHNEAGTEAILQVARSVAAVTGGRPAPVTAIIGTAGDRPDDTLRGIGRIAASLADRVAIKETRGYLRGRAAEDIVALLRAGLAEAGVDLAASPVYPTEAQALEAELAVGGPAPADGRDHAGRVVVLFCHEQRDAVHALLKRLGARPVSTFAG